MLNFSILKNKLAVTHRSEAMEADTISKNGRSLKSQMSRENSFLMIIALVAALFSIVACNGSEVGSDDKSSTTPSGVCEKLLNALIKKDYKTAASCLYTYGTGYTVDDNARLFEDDFSGWGILKYKFQDEQISADGKNATATYKITYIEYDNKNEELYDQEFELIKTESDGWKIIGDGRHLF